VNNGDSCESSACSRNFTKLTAAAALLALLQLALRAIVSALGSYWLHSFRERTKPESYSNSIKDLLRFSAFTAETHREALFPIVVRGRTFSQLAWLTSTGLNLQAATASLADKISYTKRFRVVQPQPASFFNEAFKKLTNALETCIFVASC
jgi:hypothetical protein